MRSTNSSWRDVRIRATDGTSLDAWLFTPREPNGSAVIALHGVGDTRRGMLGHAEFLLRNSFTVLVPDSRGHGQSGGDLITYGIRESDDVHCWSEWLRRNGNIRRVYGIGQSMGASILLQSLHADAGFHALVADCPFATFEEISYERLEQVSRIPKPLFWPMVRLGFLYTEVRYGVDLRKASPEDAIRSTRVPVLLIHGSADTNIPPHHSMELHAANPATTGIWIVPNAGHVASLQTEPKEYARTVVAWFMDHP